MLRVTLVEAGRRGALLRVEGRVTGPWVAELRAACERVLARDDALRLELTGLEYLDRSGIQLLNELSSRGVLLVGVPLFASAQLKPDAHPRG